MRKYSKKLGKPFYYADPKDTPFILTVVCEYSNFIKEFKSKSQMKKWLKANGYKFSNNQYSKTTWCGIRVATWNKIGE